MSRTVFFAGLILLAGTSVATPVTEIEGVKLRDAVTVSGTELKRNGAGLRTATVLHVKLYVAEFFAPTRLNSFEDVLASPGPFRFDFTFLRAFTKQKTGEAWCWQFDQSACHRYETLDHDKKAFADLFGAVKKFGVETVEIDGNETRVYDDGVLQGKIEGREFQKAFLGLWFGSKPVMPKLKTQLLGLNK